MAENNAPEKTSLLRQVRITEAVGLAAIPFIAYCMIFLYWAGYLSYFEIPLEFIPFNLPEIFIVGVAILGVLLLILGGINVVFTLVFPKGHIPLPVARRLIPFSFVYLFIFPYLLINMWGPVQWCLLVPTVLLTFAMFVPFLFMRNVKGTYIERMQASDQKVSDLSSDGVWGNSLIDVLVERVGRKVFVGMIYLILILNLIYGVGRAAAANQRLFRVANTSPETVAIFMSENSVICAPFNRNTKQVEPSFIVLPLSGSASTSFSLEDVGPLTLNRSSINFTPVTSPLPLLTPASVVVPTEPPTVNP